MKSDTQNRSELSSWFNISADKKLERETHGRKEDSQQVKDISFFNLRKPKKPEVKTDTARKWGEETTVGWTLKFMQFRLLKSWQLDSTVEAVGLALSGNSTENLGSLHTASLLSDWFKSIWDGLFTVTIITYGLQPLHSLFPSLSGAHSPPIPISSSVTSALCMPQFTTPTNLLWGPPLFFL